MRAVMMLPATVPTSAPSSLIESIAEALLILTKADSFCPLTEGALRATAGEDWCGIRSRMVLVVSLLEICANEIAMKATDRIEVNFLFMLFVYDVFY